VPSSKVKASKSFRLCLSLTTHATIFTKTVVMFALKLMQHVLTFQATFRLHVMTRRVARKII